MKKQLITLAFALALFSMPASGQEKTGADAELRSLVQTLVDAQRNFDGATLDKIFTADYVEISTIGEFDPRAKVLGFYGPEQREKYREARVTPKIAEHSIRASGDTAIVIVRIDYEMAVKNIPVPSTSLRATYVCRSEGGNWKIASAHYSRIRAPQPQSAPKS